MSCDKHKSGLALWNLFGESWITYFEQKKLSKLGKLNGKCGATKYEKSKMNEGNFWVLKFDFVSWIKILSSKICVVKVKWKCLELKFEFSKWTKKFLRDNLSHVSLKKCGAIKFG